MFINFVDTDRHWTKIFKNGTLYIRKDVSLSNLDKTTNTDNTVLLTYEEAKFLQEAGWLEKNSYLLSYLSYQLQLLQWKKEMEEKSKSFWGGETTLIKGQVEEDKDKDRRNRTLTILNFLTQRVKENGSELLVVNIDPEIKLDYIRIINDLFYYDLSEDLHELGQKQQLRFKYDKHYNPDTHNFIAARLIPILKSHLKKEK